MKRILTYIFGLIIMAAPFAPSTAANSAPTVTRIDNADTPQTVTTVTGTVLDKETNEPLIGAAVAVEDTTTGKTTDENGTFSIGNVSTDATLEISYLDYKTETINLSNYTAANDEINLGTITLERDPQQIDKVVVTAYPQAKIKPDHATRAIIYNEAIGFERVTDQDTATLTNVEGRQTRSDKTVICKCEDNYILMNRNHQSFTGTITLTKSDSRTMSYDSQSQDGICEQASLEGTRELEYLLLLATELHDKGLQCIKKTDCHDTQREVGVKESVYELNTQTNEYTCKKTCYTENGYTLNERNNRCESENTCTPSGYEGAATGKHIGTGADRKCIPSSCKCGFELKHANSEGAKCDPWTTDTCSKRTKISGATEMQRFCSGETEVCHAKSCDSEHELVSVTEHNYTLPIGIGTLQTCQSHERKCTDDERNRYTRHHRLTEWPTNIIKKETAINFDTTGARICIPTECECGYDLKATGKDAKCEQWAANTPCDTKPKHAAEGQYHRACRRNGHEYCHITECEANYKPNNSNDECVGRRGACIPSIENPQHHGQIWDSKFKTVNGVRTCVITKCATGYEPNEDGSDCTPLMVLPEKESQDRINELRTVYDEALANESSTANKALGAASMAATGAGGMMLAMGLTEQKADKEAEEKMRGYVATFKCNYGNTNVEYGVEPTELPMSTELYNLYAEYVTLANDLKLRKEMLGLRAGIESEKILDSATTGLYDDVSSGRSAGMYTSLARAILDPNGADAAAWAEQTKRSKNLIIAGATTAGVGVVGSIIGNQLINKGKINLSEVKERIKGINAKYEAFKQEFGKAASDMGATVIAPQAPAMANTLLRCPFDSIGTRPNCICNGGKSYDSMQNRCYFATCPLTATGTPPTCSCRNQSERYDIPTNKCVSNNTDTTTISCPQDATGTYPNCRCTDQTKRYDSGLNTCVDISPAQPAPTCPSNATGTYPECRCTDQTKRYDSGLNTCVESTAPATEIINISIPASTMFDVNSAEIEEDTKNKLEQLMAAFTHLQDDSNQLGTIKITVTGYTDPDGGDKINNLLSTNRAEAVRQILDNSSRANNLPTDITAEGKGSADCTCSAGLPAPTEADYQAKVTERITAYSQCKNSEGSLNENKTFTGEDVFPPCRRVEIKFEIPPVNKSVLESLGIDTSQTISMSTLLGAVESIEPQQP